MSNLKTKALLVQLAVSQWTARKKDKRATQQVEQANHAASGVGGYHKSLLPVGDALKNIQQKTTTIRNKFYKNTLPWGVDGTYILPTANYMDFMAEFSKDKSEWHTLVDTFLNKYSHMVEQAEQALGDMFNQDEYPPVDVVAQKFNIDLAAFPVPADDFRVDLSDAQVAAVRQDVEDRVNSAAEAAMNAAWQRLYDKVEHIHEKLSDPSAIYRDTLIENARELVDLLPKLNFADDPELDRMRNEVSKKLTSHDAESLRVDPDLRRETAGDAKAIMDKMSIFMGGA